MSDTEDLQQLISKAEHIVIIQADNPDADSLGSALGLEEILSGLSKKVSLYCAVDMPSYLHYLSGWSRVDKQLPKNFDLCIIVDASTTTLLEKITRDANYIRYKTSSRIVLDHHATVEHPIDAQVTINDISVSSCSELIFSLAVALEWQVSAVAGEMLLAGILGDTQGLSNNLAKPATFRVVADMLDLGVDREGLEERRRQYNKFHRDIFSYKADLIKKTELHYDDSIACVVVSQTEINTFSPLYNPAALIQPDMLQIEGVRLSIVFKRYDDGKVTGAIRASIGAPVAGELAKQFNGGGHDYASGFKLLDVTNFDETKSAVISAASKLLAGNQV